MLENIVYIIITAFMPWLNLVLRLMSGGNGGPGRDGGGGDGDGGGDSRDGGGDSGGGGGGTPRVDVATLVRMFMTGSRPPTGR